MPVMSEETTVTVTSGGDEPEAVAAVAAGAALAEASAAQETALTAQETAAGAEVAAGQAQVAAGAAGLQALTTDQKLDRLLEISLARELAAESRENVSRETVEPEPEPAPPEPLGPVEQEPPKSVGKKKGRTFRERWEGAGQ